MRFDLAAMTARAGKARKTGLTLNVIYPTQALEDDLARLYVRILREVSAYASTRLLPAYSRALAERRMRDGMVLDDLPELDRELNGLGAELERLILTLIPEMRSWTLRTEKWHRARWAANVRTATTIDLTTLIGPQDAAEAMEAVLSRNVALIKGLSSQAQGRVADAVWRGFQARTPTRETAKAINEAVQIGRRRALNIAADQTQKLSSDLDAERMRQAGIDEWIWRHSRKLHPREVHRARDGVIYTDKTAPKDLPGQLPFCGCKRQAHISFD